MTAIDTNILIGLWDSEPQVHVAARRSLDRALEHGGLMISAVVFAELLAGPERSEDFLNEFCGRTGVEIDWVLEPPIWVAAGLAFQAYAGRRRGRPRRILADFVIGAHALRRCGRLLTFDPALYRGAFPKLPLLTV